MVSCSERGAMASCSRVGRVRSGAQEEDFSEQRESCWAPWIAKTMATPFNREVGVLTTGGHERKLDPFGTRPPV